MANLTILVDGCSHFNGKYDTLEIETNASGTVSLQATFPPVEFDVDLPSGTVLA